MPNKSKINELYGSNVTSSLQVPWTTTPAAGLKCGGSNGTGSFSNTSAKAVPHAAAPTPCS